MLAAARRREIAVRKVLGANIRNILLLFMKDYAWLILIANFIGWPLAYWATNRWMQNYAYRVGQDLMPYLIVAIFVFGSAFLLIALQCFKEAAANPVRSLRSE